MRIALILLMGILVFANGCKNREKQEGITSDLIINPATASGMSQDGNQPQIYFEKTAHDFGIVLQGEKVSYTFKYKNIGKADLIIKEANASCGCTVPHFSREPIAPGETGEIEVIFDSSNRTGRQHKTITVWSNCVPNQTILKITTEIVSEIPNN